MDELAVVTARLKSADHSVVSNTILSLRRTARAFNGWLQNSDLTRANLIDADLAVFDLAEANLTDADCSNALMYEITLERATLLRTKLTGARLEFSCLKGAKFLTIQQLKEAQSLEGSILPDGTRLPGQADLGKPASDWQTPFAKWCEEVTIDEDGFISVD